MNRKQFLSFGERWHYPFLVVAPGQTLPHGKDAYERAGPALIRLAAQRIERWNEIAGSMSDRVTQAIDIVDNLIHQEEGVNASGDRQETKKRLCTYDA